MFLFAQVSGEETNMVSHLLDPKSNVINYLILLALLVWLWVKYGVPMFDQRKDTIESSIQTAKQAKIDAEAFFQEQRSKVANSEKDADLIVKEAREIADQMRVQIEEQTQKDLADMLAKLESSIANERQVVIMEMRAQAVKTAIKLCEQQLSTSVTDKVQAKLLTQFMEQLDSATHGSEPSFTAGHLESVR